MVVLKEHYLIVQKKYRESNARYYTSRGKNETFMCKLEGMKDQGGSAGSYDYVGIDKD